MRRIKHKQRCGFTLVEMTAASVITAFLAMVAVGSLMSVSAARGRLQQATETMDELRYTVDLLRDDLANLYRDRFEWFFEGGVEQAADGDWPRLRFRTVLANKARADQPEGDLYEVEYLFVAQADGGRRLCRRVCPIVGVEVEPAQTAGGILTRLSEKIAYMGIRYFDGTQWRTDWPAQLRQWPLLIEVSLAAKVVEDGGLPRVFARQIVAHFPRLGQEQFEMLGQEGADGGAIEFTEPETGLSQ